MDEIFRFFVAYTTQVWDGAEFIKESYGRSMVVMDHDIRTIDDVIEIEDSLARETGSTVVILQWWKRFADFPS